MKAANPDVVFYGGYYEQAGRLKKQLADAGVKATFISGDGSLDVGFVKAAGAAADGALLSCPCYFASDVSPGKIGEFAKKYTAVNKGAVPGTYSTEAYDAANILMTGIKAGNTDRQKLLSYVDGLKHVDVAISKDVTFAPNGNIEAPGHLHLRGQGRKDRPEGRHRQALDHQTAAVQQEGVLRDALLCDREGASDRV